MDPLRGVGYEGLLNRSKSPKVVFLCKSLCKYTVDPNPKTFEALLCLNFDIQKISFLALFGPKKKFLVSVQELSLIHI